MTNLLEKMQWLYEQGFEPDMAYVNHISGCSESAWEDWGLIDWFEGCRQPYFTESCLWSFLPEKILLDNTIFFLKLNTHIMYEPTYFTIDEKAGKPPMACLYIKEVENLHSALLDLTIWAVRSGYLTAPKPEKTI